MARLSATPRKHKSPEPKLRVDRARGGTRTPMNFRSHGPEPCASTNSATRARSGLNICHARTARPIGRREPGHPITCIADHQPPSPFPALPWERLRYVQTSPNAGGLPTGRPPARRRADGPPQRPTNVTARAAPHLRRRATHAGGLPTGGPPAARRAPATQRQQAHRPPQRGEIHGFPGPV